MSHDRRVTAVAALLASWAVALAPVEWAGRTLATFVVILLAPGFLLDVALGRDERVTRFELPARALALSIGLVGILAAACTVLGLSIRVLDGTIAAISFTLALLPPLASSARGSHATPLTDARAAHPTAARAAPASRYSAAAGSRPPAAPDAEMSAAAWCAVVALVALTAAAATLAALDVNVSRDRMWYGAYVTHLASAPALDWREPMLGSGHVAWRFAHNAWIAALAAWHSLAAPAGAVDLLERSAPPLLVALLPSSTFALARSLVPGRGAAAVVSLCSVVVLLATSYPYFSPERYAFFARIVEDKTAALVLIAPVALSLGIDALGSGAQPRPRDLVRFVLALIATALSHAIVYFVACLTLAVYAAASVVARRCSPANAAAALTICALVAIAPATLGVRARSDVLTVEDPQTHALTAQPTDPIVRAHLRMERLRDIGTGGPIVEPALLVDPLLLVALLGLAPALCARRAPWGAYASATTLVFLALAYLPFLAPAFGRLVVPWMAYRALWGVPFGLLLGGLVLALLARARATPLAVAVIVAVAALGAARLPWQRISANPQRSGLTPDAETRAVLAAIAETRPGAKLAAAPGLAELIPAYTGRPVLAFSDRGTAALAGSRRMAEERLVANAVIVGLRGTERELRAALIAAHGVTHVVYPGGNCDLGMAAVFASPRFVLCETSARKSPVPLPPPRELAALARRIRVEHDAGTERAPSSDTKVLAALGRASRVHARAGRRERAIRLA